ncbi:MAG: hypothetical protein IJ759_05970 [Bacteroidales bacterium]|nr:hypothetical protein [Bacteroidales bacterium]
MTIQETVDNFTIRFNINKRKDETFVDFCCVVINDITLVYNSIHNILAVTRCDSMQTAKMLLNELGLKGFYTINTPIKEYNDQELIYVFMCRKIDYDKFKNGKE